MCSCRISRATGERSRFRPSRASPTSGPTPSPSRSTRRCSPPTSSGTPSAGWWRSGRPSPGPRPCPRSRSWPRRGSSRRRAGQRSGSPRRARSARGGVVALARSSVSRHRRLRALVFRYWGADDPGALPEEAVEGFLVAQREHARHRERRPRPPARRAAAGPRARGLPHGRRLGCARPARPARGRLRVRAPAPLPHPRPARRPATSSSARARSSWPRSSTSSSAPVGAKRLR